MKQFKYLLSLLLIAFGLFHLSAMADDLTWSVNTWSQISWTNQVSYEDKIDWIKGKLTYYQMTWIIAMDKSWWGQIYYVSGLAYWFKTIDMVNFIRVMQSKSTFESDSVIITWNNIDNYYLNDTEISKFKYIIYNWNYILYQKGVSTRMPQFDLKTDKWEKITDAYMIKELKKDLVAISKKLNKEEFKYVLNEIKKEYRAQRILFKLPVIESIQEVRKQLVYWVEKIEMDNGKKFKELEDFWTK